MMAARFALCVHVARAATRSNTRVLGHGHARSLSTDTDFSGIKERTLVAVKPDGVQRRLIGDVIKRLEQRGFRLVGLKMLQASDKLLAQHYVSLQKKPFYASLLYYMTSGPVVAMVWEGHNVVRSTRMLVGCTDPAEAAPGTIRGDFSVHVSRSHKHPRHVPSILPGLKPNSHSGQVTLPLVILGSDQHPPPPPSSSTSTACDIMSRCCGQPDRWDVTL